MGSPASPRGASSKLRGPGEKASDEHLFKVVVAEPRVPVARQPSQIGGPDEVWLTDQAMVPAHAAPHAAAL